MKSKLTNTSINGDENAATDLVTIRVDRDPGEAVTLKQAFKRAEGLREDESYGSPYGAHDCTGKPFGSRWKRIYWDYDDEGYVFVFVHTFAYDV